MQRAGERMFWAKGVYSAYILQVSEAWHVWGSEISTSGCNWDVAKTDQDERRAGADLACSPASNLDSCAGPS